MVNKSNGHLIASFSKMMQNAAAYYARNDAYYATIMPKLCFMLFPTYYATA